MLATEFSFRLPIGYLDEDGNKHADGVMRLATAADEMLPIKDRRVQANPGYLIVIQLSRTVVRLGTLDVVNTKVIEDLFSADFRYLCQLYQAINRADDIEPIE